MTKLKPEQSAEGRRSQVYLLRLWREATEAPWRLSLRQTSASPRSVLPIWTTW
jgi:hypothetical protein